MSTVATNIIKKLQAITAPKRDDTGRTLDTFVHLNDSQPDAASNNGFRTNSRKKSTGKASNVSASSQNTTVRKKSRKQIMVGTELLAKYRPPAIRFKPDHVTFHKCNITDHKTTKSTMASRGLST